MKETQWQPLIDKIVARISSWTARKLPYARRIQLIRAVLFGIQSYWSQMFLIPAKVIKTIEAYCRSFMWLGTNVITKRALISWEKVCKPKSVGGLNILNLKQWNRAAILKLQWDLTSKADRLWIKWVHMAKSTDTKARRQRKCHQANIFAAAGNTKKVEWKAIMLINLARPKAVFSIWLIIQERMLTADRLSKWSMTVDTTCVFCNCQPENHHHLIYNCTIIMEIWNDIFKWMQIQVPANTWSQLICWFVEKAKKKSTEG
ncbi:uncharacterized protein LOC142163432 [Nicotiana tabacum]|uniref:Uncharacterized protein LOC142163432 n=1 Tax=Nicotiana tabacum TaxID=4097 RepID=A0AC58RVP8_TOBAC